MHFKIQLKKSCQLIEVVGGLFCVIYWAACRATVFIAC